MKEWGRKVKVKSSSDALGVASAKNDEIATLPLVARNDDRLGRRSQ